MAPAHQANRNDILMRFLQTQQSIVITIVVAFIICGFMLFGCAQRPTAMDYARAVKAEMDAQNQAN